MIVRRLHDRIMLVGIILVAAGVPAARVLEGVWSAAGLTVACVGAALLVTGIAFKIAAGR